MLKKDINYLLIIAALLGALVVILFYKNKFSNMATSVKNAAAGTIAKLIAITTQQIGVIEKPLGSNRGEQINEYLKSIGLNPGYSWCMAFVFWCYEQSGIAHKLKKTGLVVDQLNATKKLRVKTPIAGDVFLMDFGGGKGHAGIVTAVKGDVIETIEGNSNDNGSREGYKVVIRTRKTNSITAFIRPY